MESDVSPFNAWPVILFTTLQRAGAAAAGEITNSAPLTLCAHARSSSARLRAASPACLPPPCCLLGSHPTPEKPPGPRWGQMSARSGSAAAEPRDSGALSAPPATPQLLFPWPGSPELLRACPHSVPCRVPAVSPLLLTCSPLCRSPLPPGPGASRRMHPAGSAGALLGAVWPCPQSVLPALPCPHRVLPALPCPHVPTVSFQPCRVPSPACRHRPSLGAPFMDPWGEGGPTPQTSESSAQKVSSSSFLPSSGALAAGNIWGDAGGHQRGSCPTLPCPMARTSSQGSLGVG